MHTIRHAKKILFRSRDTTVKECIAGPVTFDIITSGCRGSSTEVEMVTDWKSILFKVALCYLVLMLALFIMRMFIEDSEDADDEDAEEDEHAEDDNDLLKKIP